MKINNFSLLFKLILLILFLLATIQPLAHSQDPSFESLLKKAESGNAEAQDEISIYYYRGKNGVPKDLDKARYWMRKAAIQGIARAQAGLGYAYIFDRGSLPYNPLEALKWTLLAAGQGNKSAMNNLPSIFSMLRPYPSDSKQSNIVIDEKYQQAKNTLKESAKSGNAYAQFLLANSYYHGSDFEQDYIESFYWYKKSAENGHAAAQFDLGNMFDSGIGTNKNHIKAFEWFKKAAEQNHVDAQYNVAICYLDGVGITQNYINAYVWANIAAASGENKMRTLFSNIKVLLSSEQIAEAQKISEELFNKIK